MMLRTLAVLSAMMIIPGFASASTPELDSAMVGATNYGSGKMTKLDRKALAEAGFAYWENFQSRIPRNSPATTNWLTNEFSGGDIARIGRASATPEYALGQLTRTAEECRTIFSILSKSPELPPLTELFLWTKTLSCYRSPDEIMDYLKRTKLSDGRWGGNFSIQHFIFYHQTITDTLASSLVEDAQKPK